jgi:hypothetical protein
VFTVLAVPLYIQAKVTISHVKERTRPQTSERSQEQDGRDLHSLSFVGKDIYIRDLVILNYLHEIVSLQQQLFRFRIVEAVLCARQPAAAFNKLGLDQHQTPKLGSATRSYHKYFFEDVRSNPLLRPQDV